MHIDCKEVFRFYLVMLTVFMFFRGLKLPFTTLSALSVNTSLQTARNKSPNRQ